MKNLEIDLINFKLLKKMKKFPIIFFLGLIVGIIAIFLMSLGIPFISDNIVIFTIAYIVVMFLAILVIMYSNSKMEFNKLILDDMNITLKGNKTTKVYKIKGLVFVDINQEYMPDIKLDFIYNETVHVEVLVHKSNLPDILLYLDYNRINHTKIA